MISNNELEWLWVKVVMVNFRALEGTMKITRKCQFGLRLPN